MKIKSFSLLFFVSFLIGCTALPQGKKYNEGGQYLQSLYGDYILAQLDYPSPALCAAELNATPWLMQHSDLKCSRISNADELPFYGRVSMPITGIDINTSFRTAEQCENFKNTIKNTSLIVSCVGLKNK